MREKPREGRTRGRWVLAESGKGLAGQGRGSAEEPVTAER